MRVEVYIYNSNNKIAHIIDEIFPITTDANTTRVIVFDTSEYPAQSAFIRNHDMLWDGTDLRHDGTIYLDAAWIAARLVEANQASEIVSSQSGLKDMIALAKDNADAIKRLTNIVLTQTVNQTAQPTRWNNIKAEIDHANTKNAFKVRFAKDALEELGFDVNGALSAAQIRQATLYTRSWITLLALLLSEA